MSDGPGLTIADRALLLAARGWGHAPGPRFWAAFGAERGSVLREAWEGSATSDPSEARAQLGREHAETARPDLARVHPSWWTRALKDESPAVRRVVATSAPLAVRYEVREALGIGSEERQPDRPAHPDAVRCVLALWTERLVGDVAERDNDPPVIVALTRIELATLTTLIKLVGLAKRAVAGMAPPDLKPRDRARFDQFGEVFHEASPRHRQLARHDVGLFDRSGGQEEAGLGLVTIARLLEAAEPYRARWALQHLPYHVAKYTRALMNPEASPQTPLVAWETEVLKAAWDRLRDEGRIEDATGALP